MVKAIIIVIMSIGVSVDMYAQTSGTSNGFSASVSINATATVLESIEISTINNISLGSVTPGVVVLFVNPQNNDGAGKLLITGRPNSMIRVNYLAQRELVRTGGSETLLFEYVVSGNAEDNQFTSDLIDVSRTDVRMGTDGRFFIWIGGRVNLSEVVFGNYEGEFAIEIEYI